ncbi:MAG: 3-isopropylmalate dehydratase small subunit [Desulfovibrionaceae bacterium]|nr:3-isopropylmalate dehydratase small subunit [Desulfovibrionaceae bacterium]
MLCSGKILRLGDHIDTDAIIPARYLVTADPAELGAHCMEGLDPDWRARIIPGGSLIVAGRNFGCGSSREHAPVAILGAGIPAVIAHSFARIFYRNAFNMGLLPLELGDAANAFQEGEEAKIDLKTGKVSNLTSGRSFSFTPLPESMRAILEAGGLAHFVKQRLGKP